MSEEVEAAFRAKSMRSVEIVGMIGRVYHNLYRPVFHKMAGGDCVCSSEIQYGRVNNLI